MFAWGDNRPYNSWQARLRERLGGRFRKIPVDAGFTCPNRDGTKGTLGCIFCNAAAFTPGYCNGRVPLRQQIDAGIEFFRRRYGDERYLVYFQSFSNTYAPIERLRMRYEEALAHPRIEGLVIATRPDCVDGPKLDLIAGIARQRPTMIEYGIESVFDDTLRTVRRGHDFAAARLAVDRTRKRGITTGGHFIVGLPGEDETRWLGGIGAINALELDYIKFHRLQILRDTPLAAQYDSRTSRPPAPERYVELMCRTLLRLRPSTAVDRFTGSVPPRFLHTAGWNGLHPDTIRRQIEKTLCGKGHYQGENFIPLCGF